MMEMPLSRSVFMVVKKCLYSLGVMAEVGSSRMTILASPTRQRQISVKNRSPMPSWLTGIRTSTSRSRSSIMWAASRLIALWSSRSPFIFSCPRKMLLATERSGARESS